MNNTPLWTPQSFTFAFEILKGAGMDSHEAVANVVAAMLKQYEADRQRLAARITELEAAYDLRGVHLDAAHHHIATLERAIVVGGGALRAIRYEVEGGNDE
jgi:tRNA(Leu) C34 or U34 (ribose-2'-O)-methylase TrmL